MITSMIPRRHLPAITAALAEAPAVALLGPRQVGKTTLALVVADTRPSVYLDLESEADRAKLAEPELYLAQHADKLVILDKIQRAPQLFQSLRGLMLTVTPKRWTIIAPEAIFHDSREWLPC
jgi:predicted AAA+ superfamily ATPase